MEKRVNRGHGSIVVPSEASSEKPHDEEHEPQPHATNSSPLLLRT